MVRRIGLLVLLIVGALGGYQIWQIALATSTFVIVLEEERDVTGRGNQSFVETEQLLSVMDYEVSLARGAPLLRRSGARRQVAEFSVRGRAKRHEIENGRVLGTLHYPGADPDRLELQFSAAIVDGDTLRHRLEHERADRFLTGPISTLVAVQNQRGDPVTGLVGGLDHGLEESDQLGVYTISLRVEDLLWGLIRSKAGEMVDAALGEQRFELEVPLDWFIAATAAEHVVRVQEVTTTRQLVPEPRSVSPASVTRGSSWSGALEVRGKNLDLVLTALLRRGDQQEACKVVERRAKTLSLTVDPARLVPGTYDLVLSAPGVAESVRLASALAVRSESRPALTMTHPTEGFRVKRDEKLEMRWDARGVSGVLLIEGTVDAAGGAWMEVYRGPVAQGFQVWDLSVLGPDDEGPYLLRMTLLDQEALPPLERRITITGPNLVEVKLRFELEGQRYGMIKVIRIDGEPIELGSDPAVIRVRLPVGLHSLRAEGTLVQPYVGNFEVTEEDQIVEIQLRK